MAWAAKHAEPSTMAMYPVPFFQGVSGAHKDYGLSGFVRVKVQYCHFLGIEDRKDFGLVMADSTARVAPQVQAPASKGSRCAGLAHGSGRFSAH